MPSMSRETFESLKNVQCPDCGSRAFYTALQNDDNGTCLGNYICTGCCVSVRRYETFRGRLIDAIWPDEEPSRFTVRWYVVAGRLLGRVEQFYYRTVNIGRTVEVWKFQLRQGTLLPGWDIQLDERKQEIRNKIFFRGLDKAHS